MSVILSVCNMKGGVGKSTSAIELSACFKNRGYSVLAIDLDQQTNMTKYVGGFSDSEKNIFHVLTKDVDIKDAIQHTNEFDIIPGSEELSKAGKVLGDAKDVLALKQVLKNIDDDYDFIVIDNAPARDVLLNMSFVVADFLIVPCEAEEGSLNGLRYILKDLQSYKDIDWSGAELMGVIITKYEKTGMHEYGIEQIKEILAEQAPKAKVWTVRKSIVASEAKSEEVSMQTGKKSSKPAIDYREIADDIIDSVTGE